MPPTASPLNAQQANDDLLDIEDVRGKRLDHDSAAPKCDGPRGERGGGSGGDEPVRGESEVADLPAAYDVAERDEQGRRPAGASGRGVLVLPRRTVYRRSSSSRSTWDPAPSSSCAGIMDVARERFGVLEDEDGICYTRTGRRFFEDAALERELLATVRTALDAVGFWERLNTDWVCLDCELMPWSAKALELVRQQYASVGTAARVGLGETVRALETAGARGIDIGALLERHKIRLELAERFAQVVSQLLLARRIAARHPHCPVPRHGHRGRGAHRQRSCLAHEHDQQLCPRGRRPVDVHALPGRASSLIGPAKLRQLSGGSDLTETGGEGAVVKPLQFVATSSRGLLQPAVKCRGREYLRIIYGPEYTLPEHLERLRERGLSGKRSLALREFALGIEGLERFVQREPLRRVHECVFGVLALESEPVDPRL